MIANDGLFISKPERLAALATRYALPTIFQFRTFAAAGGLMSYGGDLVDLYRLSGTYTGRILKGEKPADLPVQQSDQSRVDRQPQDRQGARPYTCRLTPARPRRRGDRIAARCPLLALSGHRSLSV